MALDVPSEDELVNLLDRAEQAIELASVDTILALQRVVEDYGLRLRLLLAEAFVNPDRLPTLAEALALSEQLAEALADAGLEDVMSVYFQGFRAVEAEAVSYFGAFGIEESRIGLDVSSLNAFVAFEEQRFLALADRRLVEPVRNAVMNGVVGGRPRNVVLDEITGFIRDQGILTAADRPFTDYQIETLVGDSFRAHYRQVKLDQADRLGMEVVWYQGPLDGKTRAACKAMLTQGKHGVPNMHLKSELTIEAVNAMVGRDVQKVNPLTGGGGFNCRHNISPVSAGFAASKGFKVPDDVPTDEEVEQNAEG